MPGLTHGPVVLRTLLGNWTCQRHSCASGPGTPSPSGSRAITRARSRGCRFTGRICAPGVDPDDIILGGAERYFDPAAFELQAPGTFGNVPRNSLTGPGLATLDLAFAKGTPIFNGAGGRLEFRLDIFNALNRVNFGMPQRIVFAGVRQGEAPISSAGRITSTTTGPREVQFSLRTSW